MGTFTPLERLQKTGVSYCWRKSHPSLFSGKASDNCLNLPLSFNTHWWARSQPGNSPRKGKRSTLKCWGFTLGVKDSPSTQQQAHPDISCCVPSTGPHLHPESSCKWNLHILCVCVEEKHSVTETKHSQAPLVCSLMQNQLWRFSHPALRVGIAQGAQEMLRRLQQSLCFPIPACGAEAALLSFLNEQSKCDCVSRELLLLWNCSSAQQVPAVPCSGLTLSPPFNTDPASALRIPCLFLSWELILPQRLSIYLSPTALCALFSINLCSTPYFHLANSSSHPPFCILQTFKQFIIELYAIPRYLTSFFSIHEIVSLDFHVWFPSTFQSLTFPYHWMLLLDLTNN